MSEFNFKSAICTSRKQSERLLALGLKKETADCYYWQENDHIYGEATGVWHLETLGTEDTQEHFEYLDKYFGVCLADDEEHYFIPAWSLGRLWELYWSNKVVSDCLFGCGKYMNPYAKMIAMIEYDIEDGTFNKDYLDK